MKNWWMVLAWCAGALLATAAPQDLDFQRVWTGRMVFDGELPFPAGVSFLPAAHYATEVTSLPAELRVEDAAGNVLARFAAPTNVAPPYVMHLALSGRLKPAVFTTLDGKTRLSYIGSLPAEFNPCRKEYISSLAVRSAGGAGKVTATISAGVGQADVRFVTCARSLAPYRENGRLFFTFSARFFNSALGVGSLDPAHPETGVRYEGLILFDYGDGMLRNDLAAHLFFDEESGEWRGWASNFSTGQDNTGGRTQGGINAIWSTECPLKGFHIMRAKNLGLAGMNEDPCGFWDADAKKWRLFVSEFTKSGIRARMLESDRWDGGFSPIAGPVTEDSTGTTIMRMNGVPYCLSGSVDRAYYVYAYPGLEKLGTLTLHPTPWGEAKGWPHGRGWPAFVELPEGTPHRYLLLTMDRINFPGMPKPNWTYGALSLYVGRRQSRR
ncbi:MAG: hypothetical protein IJR99_06625 [Kiritimatiellae bacterium]|nr:hypothetical protein [Kiritimatiellia bacterium]